MSDETTPEPMSAERLAEIRKHTTECALTFSVIGLSEAEVDREDLLAEVDRLHTEASIAFGPGMYMEIQQVLDKALGTQEVDGAGEGIVADITLLATRLAEAEARNRSLLGDLESIARDLDDGADGDAIQTARQAIGVGPADELPGREA